MPIRNRTKVTPKQFAPFTAARIISGPQLGVTLFLVVVGVVPLFSILWFLRGLPFQLDTFIALVLLGTFVLAVIETFAIVILWGMGRLELPNQFAHWLGGATIGEVATLLLLIVKKLSFH